MHMCKIKSHFSVTDGWGCVNFGSNLSDIIYRQSSAKTIFGNFTPHFLRNRLDHTSPPSAKHLIQKVCVKRFIWNSIKSHYTKTWSIQINKLCLITCLRLLIWNLSLRLLRDRIENQLQWGSENRTFEYRKHLNTGNFYMKKAFESRIFWLPFCPKPFENGTIP